MRGKVVTPVYCAGLLVVLVLSTASCERADPNIPKVDAAVRLFNGRFNAGRFYDIYASTDPRFQRGESEEEFTTKLASLLEEHGPIQSTALNGFEGETRWQRLFPELKPTRFIGVYNRCANGGFQELFTFDVTGNEARLLEFATSIEEANRKLRH